METMAFTISISPQEKLKWYLIFSTESCGFSEGRRASGASPARKVSENDEFFRHPREFRGSTVYLSINNIWENLHITPSLRGFTEL